MKVDLDRAANGVVVPARRLDLRLWGCWLTMSNLTGN